MKSSMNWITTIVGLGLYLLSPATVNARIWKDSTGKHEIDAEFISLLGDNVELKTSAGKILKLPLAKLSEADRAFANELAKTAAPVLAPTANKNAEPVTIPSDIKITAEGKLSQGAKFENGKQKDFTTLDIIVTALDGIAADAYATGPLTVDPVTLDGAPPLKLKKAMNDHFTPIDRSKEGFFAKHPKNGIKAELDFGEVPPETKSAGPVKGSIKVMAGGTEETVVIPNLLTQRIGTINDPAIKAAGLGVKFMRKSQGDDIQIGVQLDSKSLASFVALELIDANGVKVDSTDMSMTDDNGEAEFAKIVPKDDVKNASLKFIFRKGGKEMEIPFDIPDVKISK